MLFESKFPASTIKVLVRTVPPVVTSVIFFSWKPVSADLNFRASESTALMRMRVRVSPRRDPGKVESCVSVGTLSLCYRSYSLSRTLSYCSPAFDCKIRIYLFPNLSFAALSHVEYSTYDSPVWHTRVFYLVVLIEHIVDWNIQTMLSGERPRIHGVRLSVAFSPCPR